MKKAILSFCLFGILLACSSEEEPILDVNNEELNAVNSSASDSYGRDIYDKELNAVNSSASSSCGWGIYDNVEYDCGFKQGYDDWVFHYNWIVNSGGYSPCEKIRVGFSNNDNVVLTTSVDARYSLIIIQAAKSEFQTYWDNLVASANESDFKRGQIAAYMNARNQQPFAAHMRCD